MVFPFMGDEAHLSERYYQTLLKATSEPDYIPTEGALLQGLVMQPDKVWGMPVIVDPMLPRECVCSKCKGSGEGDNEATYCSDCVGQGSYTLHAIIKEHGGMSVKQIVDWHPRKFWPHWPIDVEVPPRKIA